MKANDIHKGMVCFCEGRQCTVIERRMFNINGGKPHREGMKGPFPNDIPKAPVKVKFDDTGEEKWVTAGELTPAPGADQNEQGAD